MAAAEIADRDGLDALSLTSLASSLGVRPPSLYSHVDGLAGLRRQLALHAAGLLTAEVAASVEGLEATDALRAIAGRLRSFAHRHPGLYDRSCRPPLPRRTPSWPPPSTSPWRSSGRPWPRWASTRVRGSARAGVRASVHGFVDLELRGGFGLPDDIDDSFDAAIGLVIDAIAAHRTKSGGRSPPG